MVLWDPWVLTLGQGWESWQASWRRWQRSEGRRPRGQERAWPA